jgi:D-beta-D-heptose 7-phosphate kinase/D-beta-D-heptose 1-phosphate adenosyltransferase
MGIVSAAQLLAEVDRARARGQTLVLTNGCFDRLHAGHRHCLQAARQEGDRLIVAVNGDASVRRLKGADRPDQPLAERMAVLAGLECVDWVVPFDEPTPLRLIGALRPDVLVKGGDYRADAIVGAALVSARGGRVVIVDTLPGWSTTALLQARRAAETPPCSR